MIRKASKVILASASLRRKALLEKAGLKFKVMPSRINEKTTGDISPAHHALHLAHNKARKIAAQKNKENHAIIIAADTIVVYKNKIFGKPRNMQDARRILTKLSNTKHDVYTALAVIDSSTNKTILDIDRTTIYTRKLSPPKIKKLALKNHDKAGAYAVQKDMDILVKKIEGDYYNVVGLPLKKLKPILELFSIKIKTF
ncbi:MAG: nucleoside triphosphate pyrophosphatase [Candidatus Omnitrophota bacterium]